MTDMFATEGRPDVPKLALLLLEGNVVLDDQLTNKIQQVKDSSKHGACYSKFPVVTELKYSWFTCYNFIIN